MRWSLVVTLNFRKIALAGYLNRWGGYCVWRAGYESMFRRSCWEDLRSAVAVAQLLAATVQSLAPKVSQTVQLVLVREKG